MNSVCIHVSAVVIKYWADVTGKKDLIWLVV